uniref:Uncharacterized protein n=1 Tax=Zonotrichia albicollis TaxID=44394 RepID=A0A8D2NC39_ZONAL
MHRNKTMCKKLCISPLGTCKVSLMLSCLFGGLAHRTPSISHVVCWQTLCVLAASLRPLLAKSGHLLSVFYQTRSF